MPFEVLIDDKQACPVITLVNNASGCKAEIYSFGGLLNGFSIPVNNNPVNIIEGFASVADAQKNITNGFKSAKLSPFVCRMQNGQYVFDDIAYKIDKFYLEEHAIHGIIYDAVYSIVKHHADEHSASAELLYRYDGSDKGYPFPFDIMLRWVLSGADKLSITTTILHQNLKPIPYIDGWHPYFNLGTPVDDYSLQFDSTTMLEFDETLVPTGKTIEDARFIKTASLQNIFLDNCFVLDAAKPAAGCVLSNNTLRLMIQPDKKYPYLQIYTPPNRKSIAIENLSGAPDAFNNGIGKILIEPNQPVSFTTSYTLSKK